MIIFNLADITDHGKKSITGIRQANVEHELSDKWGKDWFF